MFKGLRKNNILINMMLMVFLALHTVRLEFKEQTETCINAHFAQLFIKSSEITHMLVCSV